MEIDKDANIDTVILVEGESDREALEVLAQKLGRTLATEGVLILPMGGATNLGRYLSEYGPAGANFRLAGMCDAGAEQYFRSRLKRAGLALTYSRKEMEDLGFFICDRDLEDELIRALGAEKVEEIIDGQGELSSLRLLQGQPAHREHSHHDHLLRFMSSKSRRKLRYARLMTEALGQDEIPPPLSGILEYITFSKERDRAKKLFRHHGEESPD